MTFGDRPGFSARTSTVTPVVNLGSTMDMLSPVYTGYPLPLLLYPSPSGEIHTLVRITELLFRTTTETVTGSPIESPIPACRITSSDVEALKVKLNRASVVVVGSGPIYPPTDCTRTSERGG